MREQWRAVSSHPAYAVSDRGRVKRLPGFDRKGSYWRGRMLKLHRHAVSGYAVVGLSNGTVKYAYVHTLVLEAFMGPRPCGMHACHYDGDPSNNRLRNLRWDTPSGNAADTVRHGRRTVSRGEQAGSAKLTDAKVRLARKLAAEGLSHRAIGKIVGASHNAVGCAIRGTSWSHVA